MRKDRINSFFYSSFTDRICFTLYNYFMTSKVNLLQNNITNSFYDSFSIFTDTEKRKENFDFSSILSQQIGNDPLFFEGLNSSGSSQALDTLLMMLLVKLLGGMQNDSFSNTPDSLPTGNPVKGRITQGSHDGHIALDYGVPVGTEIHSTMSGKVIYAGWNNEGYGNLVIIQNGDYKTYYAHLSEIPVKAGQIVQEDDIIGISGNTGNSTGPHLHYEIRKNNQAINPLLTI